MKYLIFLILSLILISCKDGYRVECFEFFNKTNEVKDSVHQLDLLLNKTFPDKSSTNIALGDRPLIKNQKIFGMSLNSSIVINTKVFSKLTENEKKRLIHLISYLNKNKIVNAYRDSNRNIWFHDYLKNPPEEYWDEREIIIYSSNTDTTNFDNKFIITGAKDNLLLLAHSSKDTSLQTKMGN